MLTEILYLVIKYLLRYNSLPVDCILYNVLLKAFASFY